MQLKAPSKAGKDSQGRTSARSQAHSISCFETASCQRLQTDTLVQDSKLKQCVCGKRTCRSSAARQYACSEVCRICMLVEHLRAGCQGQ